MGLVQLGRGALLLICLGLSACAGPSYAPPPPTNYYVGPPEVVLRECPSDTCRVVGRLFRMDQVEQLDVNDFGWWRVRSLRTGLVGWLPGSLLTVDAGPSYAPPPSSFFFVGISSLNLRTGPTTSAPVVNVLRFNDEVERIDEAPGGWMKVRNTRDGSVGWVGANYLEVERLPYPRGVSAPKKKKAPSKSVTPKEKEKEKEKEEAPPPSPAKAKPM